MWARSWTFLIWAAVAASAVYWGLKLYSRGAPAPAHARAVSAAQGASSLQGADLSRLLGADVAPPVPVAAAAPVVAPDARFKLLGVVTPRGAQPAARGVALIAVDERPPKAYRVGAVVSGETVLRAVHARSADLGPRSGAGVMTLQISAAAGAGSVAAPTPGSPGVPGAVLPPQPRSVPAPSFTPVPPALIPGAPRPIVAAPQVRAPVMPMPAQPVQEVTQDEPNPALSPAPGSTPPPPSMRRRQGSLESTR